MRLGYTIPVKKRNYSDALNKKFEQYSFDLIQEFRIQTLDPPDSSLNKFYEVNTSSDTIPKHRIWIWGIDENDIIEKFDRFLNLRAFL
jgi:hypothetical protein